MEKYLIFTSLLSASNFIEKLEKQNIKWDMKVGSWPELWIKVMYENGYKPF